MADIDVNYDPITVNSGPITVGITGLDDIRIRYPDPIQTNSGVNADLTLRIPDPVRTESTIRLDSASELTTRSDVNANLDLQPVVLDQCLRIALSPLPPTRICLPSKQRLSLSVMGMEIIGLTLEGEARIDVTELPSAPFVKLPAAGGKKDTGLHIRLGA